jgi:two-component system response regulator TctD
MSVELELAGDVDKADLILVVDDDPDIARFVQVNLRLHNFDVVLAGDGEEALEVIEKHRPDLAVVDLMMPRMDGLELVRRLRANPMTAALPVIMLTAKGMTVDKVVGLSVGADDYLVKPFDLRELEARLRALIRRTGGQTTSTLGVGNLEMDLAGLNASVAGKSLELGRREFRLLEILVTNAGKVVPKERLMNQLFNFDEAVSVNALELHISRLRKKLEAANIEIGTVRGVGYVVRAPHAH